MTFSSPNPSEVYDTSHRSKKPKAANNVNLELARLSHRGSRSVKIAAFDHPAVWAFFSHTV
jgi:hypothetical protein